MMLKYILFVFVPFFSMISSSVFAQLKEPDSLKEMVSSGKLPAMAERLPSEPLVVKSATKGRELGHYGGSMNILMANGKKYLEIPFLLPAMMVHIVKRIGCQSLICHGTS